eukprot:m51a1_g12612 hypothetical protein (174) ;mRNA; r:1365-1978
MTDLYRVEAAVYIRGTIHVALRWFAAHGDVVGILPCQLARTEVWTISTPEEVASKAASLGKAQAVAAATVGPGLPVVDYVHAPLAPRSELKAAGLTFDDGYWDPMQYIGPWIRLVVGQKLGSSMGHSRAGRHASPGLDILLRGQARVVECEPGCLQQDMGRGQHVDAVQCAKC